MGVSAGFHLSMYESMAAYQKTYGLKATGIHRKYAHEVMGPFFRRCDVCDGRGVLAEPEEDVCCRCPLCNGTQSVPKGDKSRLVGFDNGAMAIIQLWFDKRKELGLNGRQPLICTLRGKPVCDRYVRSLLPRLGRKAGIEKRVHAHGLRHSHASELATEGTPLRVIQQQLGHSSLSVTDRCIQQLQPSDVIQAMKEREWRL